jgi:predicted kinase
MALYAGKLVILRGNSGSGKSTVAERIRDQAHNKTALISQDYLRRIVLKEKETAGHDNIDLIEQTAIFALARGYNVILEGILYSPRYGTMLGRLVAQCPNHFIYYFDVPFEETLRRHATKPNAHEFGEKEMREWYEPNQLIGLAGEKIIPENSTFEKTVATILSDTGL